MECRDLVPGDVVRLSPRARVPADIVVVTGGPLTVHQFALTGESTRVSVHNGDKAYAGSVVVVGEGVGIVDATGHATLIAQMDPCVSNLLPSASVVLA